MMRRVMSSLALVALILTTSAASALTATASDIVANLDRFDGKAVTINGTIINFRETVSRRGNPYYTFDLSDGKQAVRVFSFGTTSCRSGTATVDGTFEKVRRVGRSGVWAGIRSITRSQRRR